MFVTINGANYRTHYNCSSRIKAQEIKLNERAHAFDSRLISAGQEHGDEFVNHEGEGRPTRPPSSAAAQPASGNGPVILDAAVTHSMTDGAHSQ